MNAILNTAISPFVLILRRSGLLAEDLDYHLVRASMVIMFFFFGYQKWWPYEAERLVPFISNGQAAWNSGCRRFDRDLHRDRDDHSFYA